MFVALDKDSGKRVTSIAAEWAERMEVLRERVRGGLLVCPGCGQPLWFRVGKKLRPHFAHRQSGDCPLAHDSNEVREAKALLYGWLETKYPGGVELDADFWIAGNKYSADLEVVDGDGRRFAYWVFDRAKRNRDRLFEAGELRGVIHQVIHTESTHNEGDGSRIHLTASQREFATVSGYDAFEYPALGHLHFLDSRDGTLRIYRGLSCVHSPASHAWEDLRTEELRSALVSPKSGEIVVAADVEAREVFREERERGHRHRTRKQKKRNRGAATRKDPEEKKEHERKRPSQIEIPVRPALEPRPFVDSPQGDPPPRKEPLINQPLCCKDCGTITTDWSQGSPGLGTCVCRDCTMKRFAKLRSR